MVTTALRSSVPATRLASLSALLIDLDASSMLVMLPLRRPCAFAIPAPMICAWLSSSISAMSAQTLVEPISMAKTVRFKSNPLYIDFNRILALKRFNQPLIQQASFELQYDIFIRYCFLLKQLLFQNVIKNNISTFQSNKTLFLFGSKQFI